MSYELYVEPEVRAELKRLLRRHQPATGPCLKIASVVATAELFGREVQQGQHAHTLIETVAHGRIGHHRIPDALLGAHPPSLDARLLVGRRVASLFHVTEVFDATGHEIPVPGDDVVQAVARDLTHREDDDAS